MEPYDVESLTITVAQRYSVLVTALNATNQNYVVQANFDTDMFDQFDPETLQISPPPSVFLPSDSF